MKKIIKLTESDLIRIVKKVISEGTTGTLKGRSYTINSDGTVSIKNSSGSSKKIRFSALGQDINLKDISKSGDNYLITSKNGTKKEVTPSQITDIISFVDGTKTETSISTGMLTPRLKLKKI